MHACLYVHRQDGDRLPIPLRSSGRLGLRHQFAPKHAELKTNPGNGKRRYVPVRLQGLFVGMVRGIEVAKISQQRPKGNEIL